MCFSKEIKLKSFDKTLLQSIFQIKSKKEKQYNQKTSKKDNFFKFLIFFQNMIQERIISAPYQKKAAEATFFKTLINY